MSRRRTGYRRGRLRRQLFLEGYDWPLDGRYYGPGEKPRVPQDVVTPPGYAFDPARILPR